MRYQDPELRAKLSAEYVVGTLHGLARQRFQQLLLSDASLRAEVAKWEGHFSHLDAQLAPVEPMPATWKKIQQRLFGAPQAIPKMSRWWPSLAMLASSAFLALLLVQWTQLGDDPAPSAEFAAVMQSEDKQALWSITLRDQGQRVEAVALQVPELANEFDYELWLLAGEGQAPVSLGLLPRSGAISRPLDARLLDGASALAVSREAKGGSVSGAPTEGAVLYVAKLVSTS